jgi:hypothetical protein
MTISFPVQKLFSLMQSHLFILSYSSFLTEGLDMS